ncbi:MAG: sodium:solute symporter family protein [Ignavibacteriaceae bacterium]
MLNNMISFSTLDIIIIVLFFLSVLVIGFWAGRKDETTADDYLLSGRKVGLFLFVLTNVSTWYGGILGVGEFTYKYGIASWFTQGFPYYVFAFLFAIFFAKKIHAASLFTIPDKLTEVYGKKTGLLAAALVFILVSPAPYLLMTANLLSIIFNMGTILSLIIALLLSLAYLFKGGFRSDLYTDAIQFFVMFIGFFLILFFAYNNLGDFAYLSENLPQNHLSLTGGASPTFIIVWFLIALWTFADPGFHQRTYAAKNGNVAVKGIIISIFFWALFDFLTTATGLYARAVLPNIDQPVLSFPLLAENILPSGIKGIFYAALFATIMSTFNSFLFLSATTIGRDFIFRLSKNQNESNLKTYTIIGLIISGIVSIILAYLIPSVIEIWYTIGSFCIPGIILAVVSSYYLKLKISNKIMFVEMISAIALSIIWYFLRQKFFTGSFLYEIEPMLVGLLSAVSIHLLGLFYRRKN